ncbi:flagellar basal body P-ring formation chaperone FlgA [Dongia sp.]|uniref:flagellar basal body P-ring formation chaperone FlgA n=1 Tax=Dongia sp. TaxID=1977262 RepID=UPI0035AF35D5
MSRASRRLIVSFAALAAAWSLPAKAEMVASAGYGEVSVDEQAAPQGLSLRTNVMVDDDVIRLGDLFMESLSNGDTPIAQAPAPGQTISLDARFLRQLARAYQLDWQPDSKFEKVLVGRMSQRIDAGSVINALTDAIHDRAGNDARMELVLDGGDVEFVLPTASATTVGVHNLQYDPTTQRFAAMLVVPADGPTLQQRPVSGTIYETIDIPVFSHAMGAGITVQDADLQWISVRTDRLIGNVITDARQLVGMTTKRPLRTGQMLRGTDLVMTPAVRKNTLVTLALQSGPMNLTVTGKALEDAAIGQPIRVVNVNSKKELTGIVQDASTIVIPVAGQLSLN